MFFKMGKACKDMFAILPRFIEDLLQSKDLLRGHATGMKTALAILHFYFQYFLALPFNAFDINFTFLGKLRIDIPVQFVHCLRSPFLNIGIITSVC